MSRTYLRWSMALVMLFAVLLAACAPTPAPTATPRPATEVPEEEGEDTTAAGEETAEAETAEEAETEEAAEGATEEAVAGETEEPAEVAAQPTETGDVVEETEVAAVDIEETEVSVVTGIEETEVAVLVEEETEVPQVVLEETEVTVMVEEETEVPVLVPEETMVPVVVEEVTEVPVVVTEVTEVPEVVMVETEVVETVMEETEVPVVVAEETEVPVVVVEETEVSVTVIEETEVAVDTVEETEVAVDVVTETEEPVEVVEVTEVAVAEETEVAPMETETPDVSGGEVTGDITVSAEDQVVIGLAAGLSGEGIAPLGIDIQRGAEIAVSQRGTVNVGGQEFTVVLDVQDDLCSAEGGQTVANRFASSEGVVGVVGPMCSSACRAAAPIFDSANFTTISPSCTAPDLTTSGYTSFNRSVVSDAFQGRIAADFIYNELGITRVATIHDGSPYGEGLVNVLTARFEELGGEVVAADAVNVGDTDFRALLEDIAAEDPELIYFGGFPAEAARIAQQREDAGLEDVTMMGADGIRGTEFVELSGEAAQGVWATSALPSSSEAFEAFLEVYVETYEEEPPAPYHGTAYDAVNVLLDAVEATGTVDADGNLVLSRDAIREYVRSVEDFQGITGVLNADGTGEMSVSDIGIYQVEGDNFVLQSVGRLEGDEVVISEAEEAAPTEDAETTATEEAAGEDTETTATEEAEMEATEES